MKLKYTLCFLFFAIFNQAKAQEFTWRINITTDQANQNDLANTGTFEKLQTVMNEFMNNRRWSNDQFAPEERIICNLSLAITSATAQGNINGTATIVVTRPIFGTTYETLLLRNFDKNFNFTFLPENPINYNDNSYSDELSSMMAFYCYYALALDYDSFGKLGGNPYVQKAFAVMNNAAVGRTGASPWTASGDIKNRYWLIENLNSPQFLNYREGYYAYHRLALDDYANKPIEARKKIMDFLTTLQQINQVRPSAALILATVETKGEEMTNIFADAPT